MRSINFAPMVLTFVMLAVILAENNGAAGGDGVVAWIGLFLAASLALRELFLYFWERRLRSVRFEWRRPTDEFGRALNEIIDKDAERSSLIFPYLKLVAGSDHVSINRIYAKRVDNNKEIARFDIDPNYDVDLQPYQLKIIPVKYLDLAGVESTQIIVEYNGTKKRKSAWIHRSDLLNKYYTVLDSSKRTD